jgi:deoxyribose-phosphate aldolase
MKIKNIESYIDHTILKADATSSDIEKICEEAIKYQFASVCVNSCRVSMCSTLLKGSNTKVCSVVGFPLGAMGTKAKSYEAACAVEDGATEIDMVINIGWVKEKEYEAVFNDIKEVKAACNGNLLKVIIETCLLTNSEKEKVCLLAKQAGADFVKTSTGFSTAGAKVDDIKLMRKTVGVELGVKASGGIHSYNDAVALIEAGASRIGASAGIKIFEQSMEDKSNE